MLMLFGELVLRLGTAVGVLLALGLIGTWLYGFWKPIEEDD